MKCRYCGQERTLIKAHIIPEGFFRRMRDGSGDLRLLSEIQEEYPKRAPIGAYDTAILCADCELLFGEWDDYAQKLLGREPPGTPAVSPEGLVLAYELSEYRYDLLKLFFISLLWRASVSTHQFYEVVNLGPCEHIAKKLMDDRDPGDAQEFAVMLTKWDDHPLGQAMMGPLREKFDGINYYRFYLGGYVAHIKADRRSVPREFTDIILAPGQPLRILLRDLNQCQDLRAMHGIAAAQQNRAKRANRS